MLAEPAIKILVGPDAAEFHVPSQMLKETSTFFTAALKGPFREAREKVITLDDEDVEVFKTYLVWLYYRHFNFQDLDGVADDVAAQEMFLVHVYVFADKRGIPLLGNHAITLLAVLLEQNGPADLSTISEAYKSLPPNSDLCVALARCEIMTSGSELEGLNEETMETLPKAFICQVVRDTIDNVHFQDLTWPSENICDFHNHEKNPQTEFCARLEDR